MKRFTYEEKIKKEKSVFLKSISIMLMIAFVTCFYLSINFNLKKSNTFLFLSFSEIFGFVLSVLTLQSFIVCYKRLQNNTVYIISLVYLSIAFTMVLGFLKYISEYFMLFCFSRFGVLTISLLRVFFIFTALSSKSKSKTYLGNNKSKSILATLLLMVIFKLLEPTFNKYISPDFFVLSSIICAVLYFYSSYKLFSLSFKEDEPFYKVLAISIFVIGVKSFYLAYITLFRPSNSTIVSLSLTYITLIIIIAGAFLELYSYITKTKILNDNFHLFYKLADNNKHNFMFICTINGSVHYANKKLLENLPTSISNTALHLLNFDDLISCIKLEDILNNLDDDGFWRGTLNDNSHFSIDCSVQLLRVYNNYDSSYCEEVVVTFNDISEIVNKEIELEKLRVYNRERTDFISNISHELRTPINIFSSTLQLLDKVSLNNNANLEVYYDKYRKTLHSNCKRMLRLVNNIIDLSKVEIGAFKCDLKYYNLISLVEDVTLSVNNYASLKNINIHFDTNIEEFVTLCDSSMMERVLLNLLSNAIKFTGEYKNIYVDIIGDNHYIDIYIKDEGIGLSDLEKIHIFERFMQTDKSLKRQQEGSGLGLSIVKSLVELHDGSIDVESEVNVGSTFRIRLPKKGDYSYECHVCDYNDYNVELELSDIYEVNENI